MMDRNLGATSAVAGEVGSLGLFYQWGRKDPFLGAAAVSSNERAVSTGDWATSSNSITPSLAEQNPMTFYTGSSNYLPNESWDSKKTAYDPCPAGWRVPDGGSDGTWSKAKGGSSSFSITGFSNGLSFGGTFSSNETVWYPASGCLSNDSGALYYVGDYGYYWSVTPNPSRSTYAYNLNFYNSGYVNPSNNDYRSNGISKNMTYKEILDREDSNTDSIWLYREGIFMKAYDRSAFFVHTLIQPFKLSSRYIKNVNRDVISLGFPEQTLPKWMRGYAYNNVSDGIVRFFTRKEFDEVSFQNWKEVVSVNVAARYTPHTAMIENAPVYKTAYDLLLQVMEFSRNISKNASSYIGLRLKEKCYGLSYAVRILYDVPDRVAQLNLALGYTSEIQFILQLLKDMKEISLNTFALSCERIVSISNQLSALRGKAMANVRGE
jgi:hypothetical protein